MYDKNHHPTTTTISHDYIGYIVFRSNRTHEPKSLMNQILKYLPNPSPAPALDPIRSAMRTKRLDSTALTHSPPFPSMHLDPAPPCTPPAPHTRHSTMDHRSTPSSPSWPCRWRSRRHGRGRKRTGYGYGYGSGRRGSWGRSGGRNGAW